MKYSIGFYTGGGNIKDWDKLTEQQQKDKLSKDWYVRWSYRHPQTGLLVRQEPNIKYGINSHKTKSGRLKAMKKIKKELAELLKSGYSPYEFSNVKNVSIEYAFSEILRIKQKEVKETTFKDYKSRFDIFARYLDKQGYKSINEVDKKVVVSFLNQHSAKNSNNFRAVLSSGFSTLSDLDLIDSNFIKELKPKKTLKKQSKIHSKNEIERALKLLKEQDEVLNMFIYFVSYMFWRPIEAVRITVNDIDFNSSTITVETKAKSKKTKLIPSIVYDEIKAFSKGKKGNIFELNASTNTGKRDYLTKRFKKFRENNNLPNDLSPYSFRHYFITKIYTELRKSNNIEQTIKELSLITGHTSKAINNYIHVNDLELPKDYSKLLK